MCVSAVVCERAYLCNRIICLYIEYYTVGPFFFWGALAVPGLWVVDGPEYYCPQKVERFSWENHWGWLVTKEAKSK